MEETLNVQPNEPSGKVRFLRTTAAVLMAVALLTTLAMSGLRYIFILISTLFLFVVASNKNIRIAVGILGLTSLGELVITLMSLTRDPEFLEMEINGINLSTEIPPYLVWKFGLLLGLIFKFITLYAYVILAKETTTNSNLYKAANLTFICHIITTIVPAATFYVGIILSGYEQIYMATNLSATYLVSIPCTILYIIGLCRLCKSELFAGNYKANAQKLPFAVKYMTSAIVVTSAITLVLKLFN